MAGKPARACSLLVVALALIAMVVGTSAYVGGGALVLWSLGGIVVGLIPVVLGSSNGHLE